MKRIIFLASLLLAVVGMNLHAQGYEVTGRVTSAEDGSALPGVSVVLQGTTVGTVTDFDGNYSINVPDEGGSLMFSFVGMETQSIELDGSTVIDVVLASSAEQLDEVVVTALGIKRERREITYQTQKVVDDELTVVQPTRAAAALAGKVAGLQINVQDNGVNPSTQILLRGLRSVSGENEALIVIDGSIASQGAFDDLNPNDIGNISVLKGATAAALYGSNAANGALIVTTKSGDAGQKLKVGITSSYTAEQVAYMPDFQTTNGTGWAGAYDPIENTNWGPRFDGQLRQIGPTMPADYPLETQMVPYAPVDNNLLDFYETGDTWNNTVYISGSRDNSTFYASVGDQRSDGIIPSDTYRRNTVRVNASKRIGNIEVSANTSFFTDNTNVVGDDIGDQDRTFYWFVLNTPANIPLSSYSDWDNPLSYGYADNYFNAYYQNPYWAIGTNRDIDESSRFNGNLNFSWDIVDWVNFTTRIAANNTWGDGKYWRARQEYNADLQPYHSPVSSFVTDSQYRISSYTGDALLTAKRTFAETFSVQAILGANVNMYDYTFVSVRANNLSIDGFYDVSNGTGSPVVNRDDVVRRDFGFFGDITLGYNNYLFLNLSGRNDWTSTLAAENRSYFYPGAGLSFVFTDAIDALKDNQILSFGKLTGSFSTVYNDFGAYRINERYLQSSGFPFGAINGFYLSGEAVDANIEKEQVQTTEIGLNLGFLNGRINVNAAYFNTLTYNNIVSTQPSYASGSTSFLTNIGELQGNGFELTAGGSVIKTAGFQWDLNFNFTDFETVVNEIKEGQEEILLAGTGKYGIYAIKDMPFPQIKANVYQRDPDGRIIVNPNSGAPEEETGLEALGKTTPDFIIGLNSSVRYKGFKVSATFDYRTGHKYYEQGSDAMEFTGRSIASVSANRQDFVIPNSVIEVTAPVLNDDGEIVTPGVYEENTNIQITDGQMGYWKDVYNEVKSNYVKDASAAKIREFAVSYTLPSKFIANSPLSKVTVGFIARNPLTWLPADNRFSDPEFSNRYSTSSIIGIGGYFQGPPTKSYGFNVNIEF